MRARIFIHTRRRSVLALCLALPLSALAQTAPAPSSSSTSGVMQSMPGMDHGTMDGMAMPGSSGRNGVQQKAGKHAKAGAQPNGGAPGFPPAMKSGMSGSAMDAMQGGDAPAGARNPDYSDGVGYGDLQPHMHGGDAVGKVLIDQLEVYHGRNGGGQDWQGSAYYGTDENKLWLRSEGERSGGRVQSGDLEAFWNHAIGIYWGSQLGVRQDFGTGPNRTWAAFGVEGLAPYWFELEATGYVGSGGRTAARVRANYDVLFTQRLILTPELEFNLYGKNNRARGIGSGLSDVSLGLRLRYEIRREIAPYIGVNLVRRVGTTADYARAEGEHSMDRQIVAGIRIWF